MRLLYDNRVTRWWKHATHAPDPRDGVRPWALSWRAWGRTFARAADGAMMDDYGIVASSIAFAAFLSLLPLMSLVAFLYGMTMPADAVSANIATLVDVLPNGAQHFVHGWLAKSVMRQKSGGLALALSAALTIFSARRAGRSILHGINIASGIEQDRGPLARQAVSLAVVFAGAALLLSALVSISALAFVRNLVSDALPGAAYLFTVLLWLSLTLGPTIALLLVYRYAAARRTVPWVWTLPGTAFAVAVWVAATLGFRFYVRDIASYDSTYGSLSAVVVLLLWLMLSAYILLFGAKINAEGMRAAGVSRE